jgi:predicted ArsR family transcriptional regulator
MKMPHPLKIATTLADETRFSIYEYILQQKKSFSVQQIANHFSIHPNVARLHLTKLTEVQLIHATFEKTGRGGRPGRVYRAASSPIHLSYPKKDYSQLTEWTLQLIDKLGKDALQIGKDISYRDGFNEMTNVMHTKRTMTIDQKVALLSSESALIGYVPEVLQDGEQVHVNFTIYNCPYSNHLAKHQEIICTLHEAYLKGQMDALFTKNHFIQVSKMGNGCDFCEYRIDALKEG